MYPYNHKFGQTIQTDIEGVEADRAFLAHVLIAAPAAVDTDGILDGVEAPSGAEALVVEEFLAQPDVARNVTVAVAATTAGDIAAGNIVVAGKRGGVAISENFAVSADTPASITGNLAFDSVDSVTIPVQDGDSVTVDVGWGKKFGIPYKMPYAGVALLKLFDGSADSGSITVDASDVSKNVLALNGTPNGAKNIDLYLIV